MASVFGEAAKPTSLLGYHRVLSPKAGVRVSPLCLGAMGFGEQWKSYLGECDKKTSFEILDTFFDNGGNFIDTANNYQMGENEIWLGEWMQQRDNRDQIVLATKFTTGHRLKDESQKLQSNYQGNHAKSLKLSIKDSLRKLQTDYIDLLYVHWWDFTTGVEELMNSLHALVLAGKVVYLGISDTPAWLVVKCNDYARFHGLTPFSVYQGHWSCAFRDMEREILPMCEAEGMAIAPWGSLGRGLLKLPEEYDDPSRDGRKSGPQSDQYIRTAQKLHEIAQRKNTVITSIALAYVRHKAQYVFPIVGGRKVAHLKANIEALGIELTDEEIDEIEGTVKFDIGFPMSFLFEFQGKQTYSNRMTPSDIGLITLNTPLESVPKPKPIPVRQGEKRMTGSS